MYYIEPQILWTDLLNEDSYYTLKKKNFFSLLNNSSLYNYCNSSADVCYYRVTVVKFNRFAQRIFLVRLHKNLQKVQRPFVHGEKWETLLQYEGYTCPSMTSRGFAAIWLIW